MKLRLFAAIACCGVFLASAVHAEVKVQTIDYKDGDFALRGYLAYDDSSQAKRPGVLVFAQFMGIGDLEMRAIKKLAAQGYVAFTADVYGPNVHLADWPAGFKVMGTYISNRDLMRSRGAARLAVLRANQMVDPAKIGVIGYCFGGASALELARSGADVLATVAFHGTLNSPTPADAKNIKGRVLALQGGDDPVVPQKEVDGFEAEMRGAHIDWQLVQYGNAVHAYTMPELGTDNSKGAAYNEKADKRSWVAMTDFFHETFTQ